MQTEGLYPTECVINVFGGVGGTFSQKSKKDERKESVDSKQNVRLTLNASSTFSGVSGGLFRKSPPDLC